ncbi:hypothetical protein H5T87_06300 [bacterium]|nr:hypothetical protein [bacterium]
MKSKFFLFPLLAIALTVFSTDPLSLLIQSLEKERNLQWMGQQVYTVITEKGPLHFKSIVKYNKMGKTRVEFVSPPNFAGYVMILEKDSGVIIGPKGRIIPFPRYLQPDSVANVHIELISKSAKVSLIGEEKISGRSARIFLIKPAFVKGGYLKVWIDKTTGIRLKTERYSPDGKLLSSISLVSLQLNPPLREKEFNLPISPIQTQNYSLEELEKILRFRPLLPSYIPRGYKILHIHPLIAPRQKAILIHLSDGINPITIMESPSRGRYFKALDEHDTVMIKVKKFLVILKGNVDRKVLEQIGLSMR